MKFVYLTFLTIALTINTFSINLNSHPDFLIRQDSTIIQRTLCFTVTQAADDIYNRPFR